MKGSIFRHPSPLPVGVSSGYVMTVLGPLPISEMGVTLMHEHILLDASGKWVPPCCCSDRHLAEMPVKMENLGELSLNPLMSRDNCQLFDVDVAIEELTKYRALGGETVVDPTNIGIGRDPKALARIARLTGLNIIMGTGLYLEPSHPEWVKTSSVEQLTERLIYDLGGAEEKPEVLAGLIGEIGISAALRRMKRSPARCRSGQRRDRRADRGPSARLGGWAIGCWIFSNRKAPIYAIPCCAI
jgi:phosphotriesterase-related protein